MYLPRGLHPVGMDLHAESSFIDGVEEPYETPEQKRRRACIVVPPAATRVFTAGEKIYELCKSNHNRREVSGQYGRGYSLGRWSVWKSRFGSIAAAEGFGVGVCDIVQQAAGKMDGIDGGLEYL